MVDFHVIPVTALQQNCTLVWCTRTRLTAVIDPGGEPQRILAEISQRQLQPQTVLLTHGHFDHIAAAREVAEQLAVPLVGPQRDDGFLFEILPEQCAMFGFPPAVCFTPDRWLEDGEQITLGDTVLNVVHCPGHTPGHVAFVDTASRFAQVGDILFRGSIGRTDFPRGNHAQLLDSIQRKLLPLGDDIRFVPGHGPLSHFGEERRHNPYLRV